MSGFVATVKVARVTGRPRRPAVAMRLERGDRGVRIDSAAPSNLDRRHDAVTAAALAVVRRALIEGVPVTRKGLADEASFTLGTSPDEALRHVDAIAQRFGVSSLG
jgi:hypothetical protein